MMPAIEFKEANFTFGKPADMTDEQCYALQVFKGIDTEGMPVIISKWILNQDELKMIQETGCMYLRITGSGMPPVSLEVENPFIVQ